MDIGWFGLVGWVVGCTLVNDDGWLWRFLMMVKHKMVIFIPTNWWYHQLVYALLWGSIWWFPHWLIVDGWQGFIPNTRTPLQVAAAAADVAAATAAREAGGGEPSERSERRKKSKWDQASFGCFEWLLWMVGWLMLVGG